MPIQAVMESGQISYGKERKSGRLCETKITISIIRCVDEIHLDIHDLLPSSLQYLRSPHMIQVESDDFLISSIAVFVFTSFATVKVSKGSFKPSQGLYIILKYLPNYRIQKTWKKDLKMCLLVPGFLMLFDLPVSIFQKGLTTFL